MQAWEAFHAGFFWSLGAAVGGGAIAFSLGLLAATLKAVGKVFEDD